MDMFVHKFVAFSTNKNTKQVQSEIHFIGTSFPYGFLPVEERLQMDSSYSVNIKDIKTEIQSIRKNSRRIIFCGDPCLQSLSLKKLLAFCKENGLSTGIETFGTKPAILQQLINDNLIDCVILKIYSPLHPRWISKVQLPTLSAQSDAIVSVRKSIALLKSISLPLTVRTVIVPSYVYRLEDILLIAKEISECKHATWLLQPYYPQLTALKQYRSLSMPSLEFMEDLIHELSSKFPQLQIKLEK